MSKYLISFLVALLGFSANAQDMRGLAGNVFQGVAQNLIVGSGDSAECGAQAALNAAIAKGISRGASFYNNSDFQQCLNQKRWERERQVQQAQMERQQVMYRQQALQDEARRRQQQLEDEARRMAPTCNYDTRRVYKDGVLVSTEGMENCRGQNAVKFEELMQRLATKQ